MRHFGLLTVVNGCWLWVGWLVVGMLLMGCIEDGGENPAAAYDVERQGSIYLVGGQPRTLDPARTLSGPAGVMGQVFGGLVRLDSHLQVQPDLAAGWTVAEEGLVYTFHLHRAAQFHDGRGVTAADVVYSWERAAHPDGDSDTVLTYLGDIEGVSEMVAGEAAAIRGVTIVDDYTLQVRLREPVVTFLMKLTQPVAFVVDRENVSQGDWEYEANGTGPFKLVTWQDDDIIVLGRHEGYHGEVAQVPHLVYLLRPGLWLARYETDEVDLVGIGGDALDRTLDPNNPLSAELQTVVQMCTTVIGLNNRVPPFDDVRVRQAFNYALDKERLIDNFWNGQALPAQGALPPGMPGFDSGRVGYGYDPERARRLLAEAGYASGGDLPPISYYTLVIVM